MNDEIFELQGWVPFASEQRYVSGLSLLYIVQTERQPILFGGRKI